MTFQSPVFETGVYTVPPHLQDEDGAALPDRTKPSRNSTILDEIVRTDESAVKS